MENIINQLNVSEIINSDSAVSTKDGDLVYVEGKIKNRKYNDRDGNERYITEILSEKINILARSKKCR